MANFPNTAMMAPVERVARFITTGDEACLSAFARQHVAILENFAPYFFGGNDAVAVWARQMRLHTKELSQLVHTFGDAQDFHDDADVAFFSLSTHWTGLTRGVPFDEDGGWSFVVVKERGIWRVRNYGWAVTRFVLRPKGHA